MRFAEMHCWNQRLCLPVWGGVEAALAAIEEALSRTRLVPGTIDIWKRRPVSAMPGWRPGETLVMMEPQRSLILRSTGNEMIDTSPLADQPPLPSRAEAERRAAVCRACPHYRIGNDQCALCGCGFVVAERTRSAVARCPGERW
jgi:hypothetical protein